MNCGCFISRDSSFKRNSVLKHRVEFFPNDLHKFMVYLNQKELLAMDEKSSS